MELQYDEASNNTRRAALASQSRHAHKTSYGGVLHGVKDVLRWWAEYRERLREYE